MDGFVLKKVQTDGLDYLVNPSMHVTQYPISNEVWLFKMLNRDFVGTSRISDAFAIHCYDNNITDQVLWYVPQVDAFIYGANSTRPEVEEGHTQPDGILDMAYEQYGDRLYVLFNGDNHLYAYDNIA